MVEYGPLMGFDPDPVVVKLLQRKKPTIGFFNERNLLIHLLELILYIIYDMSHYVLVFVYL